MKLLKSVCDIAVERGYSTAWAIIFDDGRNPARMVETGIGAVFDEVRAAYASGKRLSCTNQVISGGNIFVNKNPQDTCNRCPLMGCPSDHIHVAKPLTYGGNIFGQFSVTLPNELFSPEELSVLGEIAEDLSFALHHLLLGQEKEEYHLSMVRMKKVFQDRFAQMQRPNLVVNRDGSTGHRLTVGGASNAFLDAMGFDGAITGMEVGALAENVTDGEELARIIDEVLDQDTAVPSGAFSPFRGRLHSVRVRSGHRLRRGHADAIPQGGTVPEDRAAGLNGPFSNGDSEKWWILNVHRLTIFISLMESVPFLVSLRQ